MKEYLSFKEYELLRLIKKYHKDTLLVKFDLVLNFNNHHIFSSHDEVINISKALEIRNYINIIYIKETPAKYITLSLTEKALNEFNKNTPPQY